MSLPGCEFCPKDGGGCPVCRDMPTQITPTYGPVELLRDVANFEGMTDGEVTVRRADLLAVFDALDRRDIPVPPDVLRTLRAGCAVATGYVQGAEALHYADAVERAGALLLGE